MACQPPERSVRATLTVEGGAVRAVVPGRHGSFRIGGTIEPLAEQRVTITNRHQVPVFVRLTRPGWPDLTSAETILASILEPGMTDEEKALAIYEFVKAWRIHWTPRDGTEEMHDPVKLIGVYGYGFCDDAARGIEQLARRAGLRTRVWELDGHVVSEIHFNGRWHVFDADLEQTYIHPHGHLAGVEDLAASPQIAGSYGYLYSTTHDNAISPANRLLSHNLAFRLAPGDSATFAKRPVTDLPYALKERFAPLELEGHPDEMFPATTWGVGRMVRRLSAGQHYVELPYVVRAGRLEAKTCCIKGRLAFGNWRLHRALDLPVDGSGLLSDFSQFVDQQPSATYVVWLDVEVPTELELLFQFAPETVPWLEAGERPLDVFVAPALPGALDAMTGSVEVIYERAPYETIRQVARLRN